MNQNVIRDNEGEKLGTVGNYVSRFKNLESNISTNTSFEPVSNLKTSQLPEKWNNSTEEEILTHYYKRLGDGTLQDFSIVSNKIASAINRLYKEKLTQDIILEKLKKIDEQKLEDTFEKKKTIAPLKEKKEEKVKVTIKEGMYPYFKNLKRLSPEQLELCTFIPESKLCFSSDDLGFFLTVKTGEESSFDKLFDFNQKEILVYELFKEQLGDDLKAKKLVLMSRLLESPNVNKVKKKRGRPKKKPISSLTPSCSG